MCAHQQLLLIGTSHHQSRQNRALYRGIPILELTFGAEFCLRTGYQLWCAATSSSKWPLGRRFGPAVSSLIPGNE